MNDQTDPLARRSVPCPACRGTGKVTKYQLRYPRALPIDAYKADCEVCHGSKTVPEPAEEWAERLRGLVEQARKERDWLVKHPMCIPHRCKHQVACKTDQLRMAILDVYTPIITPEQCEQARLEMAARAVAGKEKS